MRSIGQGGACCIPGQNAAVSRREFRAVIVQELRSIDDKNRDIGSVDDGSRFRRAKFTQFAFVVEAGSVDEHDRADGMQLHGFIDRVSRRSGSVRNDGQILACQCVDERGLPCVAPSEYSNVQSARSRCIVQ